MNKLLILSFIVFYSHRWSAGTEKENYYVKHVEFPQDATLEQKVDMAARLVPTPNNMPGNKWN